MPYHCVGGSPATCMTSWRHKSLACAWHCIATFPLHSNGQRDKEWKWHGTWLLVRILVCVHCKGFHGNWMHKNPWKLRCCNACKAMKQWPMMVTSCPCSGWLDTLLATKAPSGKGAERHKVHVVTVVAPDGTPNTHAGSHDFFTFRGMECATCKQLVRIWCNTCLVCCACFSADPCPCTEAAVNVADDVCEDGENNSADELATPRKPNKGCVVA